jgi:hypothetical protein
MSKKTNEEILAQVPPPPVGSSFKLDKVDTVVLPHPFMITPKHVEYAADRCGGVLDAEALSKAPCGIKGCQLSSNDHKPMVSLFIRVPQNRDLNAIEGLRAYLLAIKEKATELGIDGFAFPVEAK